MPSEIDPLIDPDPEMERCPHCGASWETPRADTRAITHHRDCAWLADQRRIAGIDPLDCPCPVCDNQPGEPCTTPLGYPQPPHTARTEAAARIRRGLEA